MVVYLACLAVPHKMNYLIACMLYQSSLRMMRRARVCMLEPRPDISTQTRIYTIIVRIYFNDGCSAYLCTVWLCCISRVSVVCADAVLESLALNTPTNHRRVGLVVSHILVVDVYAV